MNTTIERFGVDEALIRRFDMPGPRYTSYPTADRFHEGFDAKTHVKWLDHRDRIERDKPLSLYVHLPFCASICYYCACNKVITKDHSRSAKYLDYLEKEIKLQTSYLPNSRYVTQMHFGGGTPTFLNAAELSRLMRMLRDHFDFAEHGEYAIEIDPRSADDTMIHLLADLGFNRMSIGVQDFDHAVQKAVHRIQPEEMTMRTLATARACGFQSINMDLIYGLPKQTPEGFGRTLERVLQASPDRVALYSYAHLPARFKPQRRIAPEDMPTAEVKLEIMLLAINMMLEAGYQYVGLDHFAREDDELAIAQRNGSLHRNFQGYTTQADCDLLALGISSISKIGASFSQNMKTLDEYYDSLDRGVLPITRGFELSEDDLIRRNVIMDLMCQGTVSMAAVENTHGIVFRDYFSKELMELRQQFEPEEMLTVSETAIQITPKGRFFLRGIAMVFDRYFQSQVNPGRFSKLI
ncbi:MAG: oxygen-independent coproporphyrinogen III oxidase [Burkholderiaceae bacterium]